MLLLVPLEPTVRALSVLHALHPVVPVSDRRQATALRALKGLLTLTVIASKSTTTVSVRGQTEWLQFLMNAAVSRLSGSCLPFASTSTLACGGKCTSCTVPNFSSTNGDLNTQSQCTGCIPGSFLFQGQCIGSCPTGTFVSPQDNMTCTGETIFFSTFSILKLHLHQLVPPLAVLVLVPPISASPVQVVNSYFQALVSLLVLQIHIPLPIPVLVVILIARPAPDHLSTSATPAHPLALSLLTGDVYPLARNHNISTRQPRHVKPAILAALRVPDQVQMTVLPVPALLKFFVADHVLMQIVRIRAP